MPAYDYRCDDCQLTFEYTHSMHDAALKECPHCKGERVKRLISTGSGIIFKGAGFYVNDKPTKNNTSGGEGGA